MCGAALPALAERARQLAARSVRPTLRQSGPPKEPTAPPWVRFLPSRALPCAVEARAREPAQPDAVAVQSLFVQPALAWQQARERWQAYPRPPAHSPPHG